MAVGADKRFLFQSLPVAGAFVADIRKLGDARGFFARMFCMREFGEVGFSGRIEQVSIAESATKGTLRGMHYQLPPKAEAKIVSVIRGAVWDVVLDLRPSSPTFGKYAAAELSADNNRIMCVPKGCAHGYITLADKTTLSYLIDEYHAPDLERGVRWDDPAFAIDWPLAPVVISAKDKGFADFAAGAIDK